MVKVLIKRLSSEVNLPSYKSGTSNPLAKAESIIKMKRLYKELIKPKMLRTMTLIIDQTLQTLLMSIK